MTDSTLDDSDVKFLEEGKLCFMWLCTNFVSMKMKGSGYIIIHCTLNRLVSFLSENALDLNGS